MLYTLLAVSPWASRGSYLKWFFPSLEGVPSDSEHLLTLLPLRSISLQTISVGFRSGGCGGRVFWGNTPHSPSLINRPHMINRPHTAWRCYWGHWKMNTGPAKHTPDRLAYRCCGCHDASVCLQCHQQSTAALDGLICHLFCITQTQQVDPKISNLGSSTQSTDFHWFHVHFLCVLEKTILFCLLLFLSCVFFFIIKASSLMWSCIC